MRSSVVSSGHSFASLRASRGFSQVLNLEEEWRGIEQFLYVAALSADFDDSWKHLSKRMSKLKKRLLTRDRMMLNITADPGVLDRIAPQVSDFYSRFPSLHEKQTAQQLSSASVAPYQALIVPTTVNYSAMAFPASRLGEEGHAYEVLVSHILKVEALWEKIRMQGGAYGAFASANATEGIFSMASYRDPHTHRTFTAFREALLSLTGGVDPVLLEKAIISVVGRELRPLAPGEEGLLAFRRRLYGISDDLRQAKREQLLSATPEQVRGPAERLVEAMDRSVSVLVTSSAGLEEASAVLPSFGENGLRLPV